MYGGFKVIYAKNENDRIVVVGLGYVGLPLALGLAEKHAGVVGFDADEGKCARLRRGEDSGGVLGPDELAGTSLVYSSSEEDIRGAAFYIVAVPTPVRGAHVPDLSHVVRASETVGRAMRKGSVVCYESTVYPGVTEDVCGPALARASGLRQGVDFKLGYSPERINPGDRANTLRTIVKIVSGEDAETGEALRALYASVVDAGVYLAPSIKVAEAAKVVENTQRDVNIALMNELSLIFDLMDICTRDVLDAAGTKWNFIRFTPGLVGGHCIGVDPYYLAYRSEELGFAPGVIREVRKINELMGRFIALKTVKLLCASGRASGARVGVYGIAFKENVTDLRNSRAADIVTVLREYGVTVLTHDPLGDPDTALREYGIALSPRSDMRELDAVVLAVPHDSYREEGLGRVMEDLRDGRGIMIDVKSMFREARGRDGLIYWAL
jgi:UDP-N-acetyl-D-galactosamine dehydrogenase